MRKIVVRQQIIIEWIVSLSAWDDSSALSQAESEFEQMIEPILEELRELGFSIQFSDAETFVKDGDEQ